jgi:hypothetical protein
VADAPRPQTLRIIKSTSQQDPAVLVCIVDQYPRDDETFSWMMIDGEVEKSVLEMNGFNFS